MSSSLSHCGISCVKNRNRNIFQMSDSHGAIYLIALSLQAMRPFSKGLLVSSNDWQTSLQHKPSQAKENKEHKHSIQQCIALFKNSNAMGVQTDTGIPVVLREHRTKQNAAFNEKSGSSALRSAWTTGWASSRLRILRITKFCVPIRPDQFVAFLNLRHAGLLTWVLTRPVNTW